MRNNSNCGPSILILWVAVCAVIVAACGCANNSEQAIDLYVDAVALSEMDQNQEAIAKLNQAVEVNRNYSLAYSLLGQLYMKIQDYENSAAAYEMATELNPWSFKDFFDLGRAYELMERFAEAVKAYSRAVELEPGDLQANVRAAKSYYELKDYQNATVYAGQAERINPNEAEVHELLGDIYGKGEDYEQAVGSYKRALELDSDNAEIMTALAVAYLKTKRPSPACELLRSAVKIEPGNGQAYKHLGYTTLVLYLEDKKAYEAEAANAAPDQAMLDSLKRSMDAFLEESIASYTKAVELNEEDWDAHRGLGVSYIWKATAEDGMNNELKEKALYHWNRSLEINPQQSHREKLLSFIRIYSRPDSGR